MGAAAGAPIRRPAIQRASLAELPIKGSRGLLEPAGHTTTGPPPPPFDPEMRAGGQQQTLKTAGWRASIGAPARWRRSDVAGAVPRRPARRWTPQVCSVPGPGGLPVRSSRCFRRCVERGGIVSLQEKPEGYACSGMDAGVSNPEANHFESLYKLRGGPCLFFPVFRSRPWRLFLQVCPVKN